MQLQKSGIRVLGISDSYSSSNQSILCGVVMRRDIHIDGFIFGSITVGGDDATEVIITMITKMERKDITAIILNGCVIAGYNIISPETISTKFGIPVICVSYEQSDGLEGHIAHHFPGNYEKMKKYEDLGTRIEITLNTGYSLFARGWGITDDEMIRAIRIFTLHGKIPEPIRVARLCARSIMQYTDVGI
ncbi:MAG TPA: DUF99 family protein [Methanospirillum sp.]|nr:DUF99 family protein [Methanospirillum sp.]